MNENQISYLIRGAIFDVYNKLGPGLLEIIYVRALIYELEVRGLSVKCQVPLNVIYEGVDLGVGLKMDLVVEERVLIEVKSVAELSAVHHKQVIAYLKISGLRLGLLVNFNTDNISGSILRKVNGL